MSEEDTLPRCFAYGRHSTKKQSLTKRAQYNACKRYYKLFVKGKAKWCGLRYDSAVSGSLHFSERDEGRFLWAKLRSGDHVIFSKIDRGFRSVADGSITISAMHQRGVIVHIVDLNVDTQSPLGQFFLNVLMSMAQLERDFARTRTKEVLDSLQKANLPYCRSAPIGWKTVGEKPNKRYHVDFEERRCCDAMAELRKQKWSQEDITKWYRRQRLYKCKRSFATRDTVRQALMAREYGYPKVVGYKRLRTLVREGKLSKASPSQSPVTSQ